MRALILVLAALSVSAANAFTIKNVTHSPFAGTPGKVKLIVTPGEITNLGKLDLLIIVDDSGSMDSHQRVLSNNVPALVGKLANFSSLNVGVINSSMSGHIGANGKFSTKPRGPAVLNNTMPDFKQILEKRIIVGTTGDGTEQFFAPIIAALSPPLIDTHNKDFLRPDAHLGIVIVTDTDDQSPNVSPEQFIIHLATLKERNYSLINFIADPADRNCASQNPGKMPERLHLAKYMASGSQYNICSGKFAEGVSDVASKVERELQSKIVLPMKPDISTMTVTYGALTFPANDMENGWTYDEPTNTLILGTKIDFNVLPPADLVISFTVK